MSNQYFNIKIMNKDFTDFEYEMQRRREDGTSDSSGVSVGGGSGTLIDAKPFPGIDSGSDSDSNLSGGNSGATADSTTQTNNWNREDWYNFFVEAGFNPDVARTSANRMVASELGFGTFVPDPSLSPDENLANFSTWITGFMQNNAYLDVSNPNLAVNFVNTLSFIGASVKKFFDSIGYESKDNQGAIINIIEKAANIVQTYSDSIFNNVLNYQSWYLQQEYNSPLNQLKRLEAAGLSSAFIFGNFSNTASSPASGGGSGFNSAGYMSGAGETVQSDINSRREQQSNLLNAAISGAEATGRLIEVGVGSSKTLAEAQNIRLMTPLQIQNAVQEVKNKGVLRQYMETQSNVMEQTNFRDWFKMAQEAQKAVLDNAQQDYNVAISDETAKRFNSYYIDEQVYTAAVTDRNHHQYFKDFNREELERVHAAGGYTEDGSRVVGSESWSVGGSYKSTVGGEVGFKGIGTGKSQFELALEGKYSSSSQKEDTTKTGTTHSSTRGNINESGHYVDNGNAFKIGNTTFKLNTRRKRVDSEEYKRYMEESRSRLVEAKNRFNLLSDDAVANWFYQSHIYNKNYSEGVKHLMMRNYLQSLQSVGAPAVIKAD